MQTQQQSKDSLNTTSSSPQSLWQKLNSPEYTKIVGKRIFCCSLLIIFISFALGMIFINTFIENYFREVFLYSFLGLPIGGFLWIGKLNNCRCRCRYNDYTGPKSMSILDARHPNGPNYWNRH